MRKTIKFLVYLILIVSVKSFAQADKSNLIIITGATAHIGNGQVIKNSRITIENGKITAITEMSEISKPYKSEIIQAKGQHVYPGFIALNSTLGLIEIDAVKATRDSNELGTFNPHIRSIVAYNPESKVTETVKVNGVLMGQITPRGGRISGTSSVVQFEAWNYEDAVVRADEGIHINWANSYTRTGWWAQPGVLKENKKYIEQTQKIANFFENTKPNSHTVNLKYESIKGLFDGSKTCYLHVNGEKEIIDAIEFTNKYKFKKVVLVGGYEAYKLTDLLLENNIAVIVRRIHSLPRSVDQDIKLPFKMAKLLMDAGILVSFDTAGGMERMQTRNLPFYAGTAVAYGLEYEKAITMLTQNAAKILGIDKKIGTLEVGKQATLFISDGDALDMRTNNVKYALINGRRVNLDTHQKRLYEKFSEKYEK